MNLVYGEGKQVLLRFWNVEGRKEGRWEERKEGTMKVGRKEGRWEGL